MECANVDCYDTKLDHNWYHRVLRVTKIQICSMLIQPSFSIANFYPKCKIKLNTLNSCDNQFYHFCVTLED